MKLLIYCWYLRGRRGLPGNRTNNETNKLCRNRNVQWDTDKWDAAKESGK